MDDTFDLLADLDVLDDLTEAPPPAAATAPAPAPPSAQPSPSPGHPTTGATFPAEPENVRCALQSLKELVETTSGASTKGSNLDAELGRVYAWVDVVQARIGALARFLRTTFSPRFPELSALVPDDVVYASVVGVLSGHPDSSSVVSNGHVDAGVKDELRTLLPAATAMVVAVSLASTSGTPLAEPTREAVARAATGVGELVGLLQEVEAHVASLMAAYAPNLTAIVGPDVAARVLALAGGLKALVKMPADTLQVLGKEVHGSIGGARTLAVHEGVIFSCPLVESAADVHRAKIGKVTAAKSILAARTDAARGSRDGAYGRKLRGWIENKAEKLKAPNKARMIKALPIPGQKKSNRRGGVKARRRREKWEESDLSKATRVVRFGEDEDDGSLMREALKRTMAKKAASGVRSDQKHKFSKAMRKRLDADAKMGAHVLTRNSGNALSALDPDKDLDGGGEEVVLTNPAADSIASRKHRLTSTGYFDDATSFQPSLKKHKGL